VADIIQFPTKPVLAWDVWAKELRDHIRSIGGSEKMIDWVLMDMKARLGSFDWGVIDVDIPQSAVPAFNSVVSQYRSIIFDILLKFTVLEINLYNEFFGVEPESV
jgi:hypothetical protein